MSITCSCIACHSPGFNLYCHLCVKKLLFLGLVILYMNHLGLYIVLFPTGLVYTLSHIHWYVAIIPYVLLKGVLVITRVIEICKIF